MKLMVINAVETRGEKDIILNPKQIEMIDSDAGMSRLTTASGREIYTKTSINDLYTLWMMALYPVVEMGYNAGFSTAKAQFEQVQSEGKEDV